MSYVRSFLLSNATAQGLADCGEGQSVNRRPRLNRTLLVLAMAASMASLGCTHGQHSDAERVESNRVYVVSEDSSGVGTALAIGGAAGHDCQKEHEECMARCWKNRYPWPHSEEQGGWYYQTCVLTCRAQFVECDKEQEEAQREREKKLRFTSVEQALSWLKNHKENVTLGTIIVAGGAAFALAVNPAGWLVLIPVIAL